MAQPVWITDSGSLGTIQEGQFFQLSLLAYDPDTPNDKTGLFFSLLAGSLPAGIQVGPTGIISGIPKAIASVQGVPLDVGENVTSKFSVRAYTKKDDGSVNRLNDRTFEITVIGQDIPEFVTPAGQLGRYFDGEFVDYDLEFTDVDNSDSVRAYLAGGNLPPGLELTTAGKITGFIDNISSLDPSSEVGFDRTASPWDLYPFDFSTRNISKEYQFTVKITDGKEYRLRTFTIFVYDRRAMTADNIELTADNTDITADGISSHRPYIDNYNSDLGTYNHNNFFMHQFEGVDPDDDAIVYTVESGILPPNTSVDPDTGWMFGYLTNIGLGSESYSFVIKVAKASDPGTNQTFAFTITLEGDIDTNVTWLSDTNLGTLDNGETSTLYVAATHVIGETLYYRLNPGSNSRLPQGLALLETGEIAGRVSYQTFSLDSGTTTFDKNIQTRLTSNETTWDRRFTFTVEAYNADGQISVTKDFIIDLNRKYDKPCQCLRLEAFLSDNDRESINNLLHNRDIFRSEWIYRANDPWYGVRKKVWYEHAYGMEPSLFSEYLTAVEKNHYNKQIILGEIKTARALDNDGNVLYEVVYSQIIDDQVNNNNESVAKEVTLKYPINKDDSTEITTVYPNSLENMREQVVSEIGQIAPILPRWMLSKQENGSILGFTRAWVIAYTKPGRSKQIKYLIDNYNGIALNKINFEADRYVLGWQAAKLWDSNNDEWYESRMTTFDRTESDPYATPDDETIFDGGSLRFIYNVDKYEYTDAYDKYIIFPKRRIIDNGE